MHYLHQRYIRQICLKLPKQTVTSTEKSKHTVTKTNYTTLMITRITLILH